MKSAMPNLIRFSTLLSWVAATEGSRGNSFRMPKIPRVLFSYCHIRKPLSYWVICVEINLPSVQFLAPHMIPQALLGVKLEYSQLC